jgi:hypothetical protein
MAFYGAPEDSAAAFGTNIAGFFVLNPSFGTDLSPMRNGPQDDLLADRHRERFNVLTRKCIALVASFVAALRRTRLDGTCGAVGKDLVG